MLIASSGHTSVLPFGRNRLAPPFVSKGGGQHAIDFINNLIKGLRRIYAQKPFEPAQNMQQVMRTLNTPNYIRGRKTPVVQKYAQISNAVYFDHKTRRELVQDIGYSVDGELETSTMMVVFDKISKKAILAFRGTKLPDIRDVQLDIALILNKQLTSDRFRSALVYANAAIVKYGKRNLSVCGHSIGATIGIHVAQELGLSAHVYNPGYSPFGDLKAWFDLIRNRKCETHSPQNKNVAKAARKRNHINIYIVKGDYISNLILSKDDSSHRIHVFERSDQMHPHYLGNFFSA